MDREEYVFLGPLLFSRVLLLFLCFIFVTGRCLIFEEYMFGYGRTVVFAMGRCCFFGTMGIGAVFVFIVFYRISFCVFICFTL